jgi:hypothetical protein
LSAEIGPANYLVDDLPDDLPRMDALRMSPDDGPPVPGGGSGGGSTNYAPPYIAPFSTNGLWIQMEAVSNGLAWCQLMNATDYVYAIWSTTNLLLPWNLEAEEFPGTNQNADPFTVPTSDRPSLFLWATDWTGVTSNGNQTPDWWFYYWFGTTSLSDTNVDGGGVPLHDDYQSGADPNVIAFTIRTTNFYVTSSVVSTPVGIAGGVPFYFAVLVDDTNLADANWFPYTSSTLTVNLGLREGWHDVWIGLRGRPAVATASWRYERLNLSLSPPPLVITNPTNSVTSQPVLELQGYSPRPLSAIR